MADTKRTHLPRIHSSLRELADFSEVKDKLIDGIELSSDLEFFAISRKRVATRNSPVPALSVHGGEGG